MSVKKQELPRNKRKPGGVNFVLTDRDVEILKCLARYRYLQTSQIQRLIFPENKSIQSARRRLKILFHNKIVGRIEPFAPIGRGTAEVVYCLDKLGYETLDAICVEVKAMRKQKQVKYGFLQHAIDVSEFRIHLEIATNQSSSIQLHRFVADHELKTTTQEAIGKKRYKLFDSVYHTGSRQSYTVYPDALIIFRGRGEYEQHQKLYFLEIDRGTEGMKTIQEKVIGYSIYQRENIFKKYGDFADFRVLFQTTSPKRAANMRKALTNLDGQQFCWITDVKKVDESSILTGEIWVDHELNRRRIVKA